MVPDQDRDCVGPDLAQTVRQGYHQIEPARSECFKVGYQVSESKGVIVFVAKS